MRFRAYLTSEWSRVQVGIEAPSEALATGAAELYRAQYEPKTKLEGVRRDHAYVLVDEAGEVTIATALDGSSRKSIGRID